MSKIDRDAANRTAFEHLCGAEPMLVDLGPAIDHLPGMRRALILTSGPPLPFAEYVGGQRDAIIGAAQFEGLAADRDAAIAMLEEGQIAVAGCHDHGAVGSLAGVYTASMPVFAVRNTTAGNLGYCNFYEGTNPRRLNYGVYDAGVHERLLFVQDEVAPVVAEAVRRTGGVALKPIMQRALHMGDELHSRNTAAALLFLREIVPSIIDMASDGGADVKRAIEALTADHYFFLRLSMAAAKATADAAHGVEGSSVVSAMGLSCKEFAIRVSGLGDEWFTGPHAEVQAHLFDGHHEDEITWMGGESPITETIGLGGFAQAAAFPLLRYQGGSADAMVERNLELYRITVGENTHYHIPYLGYRGSPTGIDVFKVLETGVLPAMDIGIAGRDGGQIGAGVVRAPMTCFERAGRAWQERYGSG